MSLPGLLQLTKTSEKRGPWVQVHRVSPRWATTAHCSLGCKSPGIPWHLGEICLWGKKRGEGKAQVCSRPGGGGVHAGTFVLRVFISLLQATFLGEVLGKGFSRIIISFPGVSFQGVGLVLVLITGCCWFSGRWLSVLAVNCSAS